MRMIFCAQCLITLLHVVIIGPIPWGHSCPLCHALSLSLSVVVVVVVVVDIDAQAACDSGGSSDPW